MAEPGVENIDRILVVGAGAMGSQIGLVCSLAGYEVTVQDVDEGMLEKAKGLLRINFPICVATPWPAGDGSCSSTQDRPRDVRG